MNLIIEKEKIMNFAEKIKSLRTKAQESQAANKIIDMLKALDSNNDETTAYRWIWELIQNAKDVPNSSGKVDIEINFDERNKTLEFKHNGKLFSTRNIIFLIEQVSTKERDKIEQKEERTTGKFGTGFLTTHLLSKKVTVSGYIQDENDPISKFSIVLDRTSGLQKEIIASIERSCSQLEANSFPVKEKVDENGFNTCFTYELDNYGANVAKEGIDNLIISAPFVFAFVPEINSIKINAECCTHTIERHVEPPINLDNSRVVSTSITTNGQKVNRYIALLQNPEGGVEIAVEVERKQGEKWLCAVNKKLPKLYCDFPLLGTSDFAFPAVINCRSFSPTEPRNGIFLTSKEAKEDSDDVKANKKFVLTAVELFKQFLDYFLKEQYKGIYNIVKINNQPAKDWISAEWIEANIINELKNYINNRPLIESISGEYCCLVDEDGHDCLLMPTHQNDKARILLWELTAKIYPDKLPKKEEFEYWYNSLWEECHNFRIDDLIGNVEKIGNVETFQQHVGKDWITWLKDFYNLIYNRDFGVAQAVLSKEIIPNQNGDFCLLDSLQINDGVDDEYYRIAKIIGLDLRSKIVDSNVSRLNQIFHQCEKYDFDSLCNDLKKQLRSYHNLDREEFYKNIICLSANADYSEFVRLMKLFYGDDWSARYVSKVSDELSDEALEYWIGIIIKDIAELKSLEMLSKHFGCDNNEYAINWLNKLYSCLHKLNKYSLIINSDICPTQNGDFRCVSELYLDSGEIAEETKDVLNLIGRDVREELIHTKIILKPVRSRTRTNEEIAAPLINYIKTHQKNLGTTIEEKSIFQSFYRYLRDHERDGVINKVFELLYSNLHWFYNDEDIAANMQKVEAYDSVLSKYGVDDIEQLECILSKSKTDSMPKVEITPELLAQWGITSEEELNKALQNNVLGENFVYTPTKDKDKFIYVQSILQRSKDNILRYLGSLDEYDVSAPIEIAKTVFLIRKNDEEIYVIPRPSDYNQVVIYYNSELDVLDYEKDCELWVENGMDVPIKLTFGKILKLTGVNKIPLRGINKR